MKQYKQFFNSSNKPEPLADEEVEVLDEEQIDLSSKVILFNDDFHTFDEVTNQIIKAIKCTESAAEAITWEVHSNGKALVFDGEMSECLRVSSVLEEIGLHTQIEY
ncbi:ATP-dependent Clp protease adaptor ClpS [Candidatus Kapabacteria bacterium]|nr:ATP-dependent Clp protease adaptor ClpS [Candidatus Kapabacteria bacterium]